MPALDKYYEQMCAVKDQVAARAEMLRALATGRIRPEEEANAALYYARGIARLREIEPERLRAIFAFEKGEIAEPDEAMGAAFEEGQAVVDLFREGAQKRRCDFAVLRPRRELPFCFDYIGGLRDAVRLLHADALRRLRAGEQAAAAERLAIVYRLVAHLEQDEPLLSAVLAHRIFDRTNEIATGALKNDAFAAEQRAVLLTAAERIARKDPFGYISSLLATRDALGPALYEITSPGEFDPERYHAANATVKRWDGDELLYMLVILDTMARAGEEGESKTETNDQRFVPLADVISLPELDGARREATRIAPRLARGEIEIFDDEDFPRFGRVVKGMHSARGDLRRALAALRSRERPPGAAARDASASPAGPERP
jgi:hypothetical protein